MSRSESLVMLVAFLGVAILGVLPGIVVAVGLAILDFLRRAWDPYRAELVDVPGMPGYHDVSRHPDGQRVPGLLILRFDAPLFFGNGADLVFAEMKGPVNDRLLRYGMGARFSPEHFFPTVSEAVRAFQREEREA